MEDFSILLESVNDTFGEADIGPLLCPGPPYGMNGRVWLDHLTHPPPHLHQRVVPPRLPLSQPLYTQARGAEHALDDVLREKEVK